MNSIKVMCLKNGQWVCKYNLKGQKTPRQLNLIKKPLKDEADRSEALKALDALLPQIEAEQDADMEHWTIDKLAKEMVKHVSYTACSARKTRLCNEAINFTKSVGRKPLSALRPEDLERFLANPEWEDGNRETVGKAIKAIPNFWIKRGKLANNPLKYAHVPTGKPRGMECMLEDAEYALMIGVNDPDFTAMTKLLEGTGARPTEILEAKGSEYRADRGKLMKQEHKGRHKGKERSILIPTGLQGILAERVAKYGDGLLFPEWQEGAPSHQNFRNRFIKWRDHLGIKGDRIPYGLRHRFAVRQARKGTPLEITATLMGHVDTAMLRKCYAHVGERIDEYRSFVD